MPLYEDIGALAIGALAVTTFAILCILDEIERKKARTADAARKNRLERKK